MLGLTGSHRVGKSTLGKALTGSGFKFVPTSVSQMFRDMGLDPASKFDFPTRLSIQQRILLALDKFYRTIEGEMVVTDRTPLDTLAYLMSEATGDAVPEEFMPQFMQFMDAVFAITNRHFSCLLLVQPGIPVIDAEGKAVGNPAYMEQLNMLLLGMMSDGRLKPMRYYIPRSVLTIEERVKFAVNVKALTVARSIQEAGAHTQFH